MLLKKPYAILIKYFKLLHVILALLSAYSIYKINSLLMFFNNYLSTQESIVGQNLRSEFFEGLMFIIPITIFLISILLFFLMKRKEKPFIFYLCNTFVYLFVFLITIYAYSFLGEMNVTIADLMSVRVLRDILIIILVFQSLSILMTFMRAIGFDIKQFEFLKDLQQLEISEEDQEEFELDFGFDSNERKRKRNRKIRLLKYTYRENRSFVNFIIVIIIAIGAYFVYSNINIYNITNKEGKILKTEFYDMELSDSRFVNTSYNGQKITDNYLLVVNLKIKTRGNQNKLLSKNFKLKIGKNEYYVTNKYDKELIDIGIVYDDNILQSDYNNYLLVYEIPADEKNKKATLVYYELTRDIKIRLEPKEDKMEKKDIAMGEELILDDETHITVNDFDFSDKYMIGYNFCITNNCYNSIRYLVPTLDTNYDKVIMKISGSFFSNNQLYADEIANFIASNAYVEYELYGYSGVLRLKKISDDEIDFSKNIYFEIDKRIINAQNIRLVIHTRNISYVIKFK